MDDIFDFLFQMEHKGKNVTDEYLDKYVQSIESQIEKRGKQDVLLEKFNNYYQRQYGIEQEYSKAITSRLEKIKTLDNLSKQEIDLVGKYIKADVDLLRRRSIESQFGPMSEGPGRGSEKAKRLSVTTFGQNQAEIADMMVNQMELIGDSLVEKLSELKGFSKFSKGELQIMGKSLENIAEQVKGIKEATEEAKDAFEEFLDDKIFSRFTGGRYSDGIFNNAFTKIFGLKRPLMKFTDNLKQGLTKKFEGLFDKFLNTEKIQEVNTGVKGMESGMQGVSKFAGLSKVAIVGIAGVAIAFGLLIYKAFSLWKQFKETTIDIQRQFGLTTDRADILVGNMKDLYASTAVLGMSWEENVATMSALQEQFKNVNAVTKELGMASVNYQKAYGFTADEAAEVLKTNKLILGLSDEAMKLQDDHIVKYSNEIGFSAKEMKKAYSNAKLVSQLGYGNIDKLAKAAAKAKMSFDDMKETVDEIFELGDFEGSVEKAARLMQLGIQIDPFEVQFNLAHGGIDAVHDQLMSAFKLSGTELGKIDNVTRKMLVDILGGEQNFQRLLQAQMQSKKDLLTDEQKIAGIRDMSFEDLVNQTTQVDKLGGMWETIKRSFASIASRYVPAIERFIKGLQDGFRPFLESMKIAELKGEGLFGEKGLQNIESWGKSVGEMLTSFVSSLETIAQIAGWIIQPVMFVTQSISGIYQFIKGTLEYMIGGLYRIGWLVTKVIDAVAGTDMSSTLDKFANESFQAGDQAMMKGVDNFAGAGLSALKTFGYDPEKEDTITQKEDNQKQLVEETKKTNKLMQEFINWATANPGSVDTNKILIALSKAGKV